MGLRKKLDVFNMHAGVPVNDLTTQYIKLYNREVKQFYQVDQFVDYEIRGSRIHVDSHVRYLEKRYLRQENLLGEEMGVYWSGKDKRKFFKLLERYSIHRLDDWWHCIGNKSKIEVLQYYDLLRRNVRLLKDGRFKKLLRRSEIPIAYEVSEQFIELEELMAERLMTREDAGAVCPLDHSDSGLVKFDDWNAKWLKVYRRSQFEDGNLVKTPLPFSLESVQFIEGLVVQYVKRLLHFCVLPNINDCEVGKSDLLAYLSDRHARRKWSFPTTITREHIDRGLTIMRHEDIPVYTPGGNTLETLHKFGLVPEPLAGNVFRNRAIRDSLLPEILSASVKFNDSVTAKACSDELTGGAPTSTIEQPLDEDRAHYRTGTTTESLFIKKMAKLDASVTQNEPHSDEDDPVSFTIVKRDGTPDVDATQRLDNATELSLYDWEAGQMDHADMVHSSKHESTLFHYFMHIAAAKSKRKRKGNGKNKNKRGTHCVPLAAAQTGTPSATHDRNPPIQLSQTLHDWFLRSDG
ncbi:Rrn5p KNAG_0A02890 [Huiozyma naganishii CBS 8797]|uniref:Uncharacterized protein n=1 Tax=Huiozyma naganishii (strain ATCC MYA-139 / BCRC 22969 / CBS 8797 / KCTC 17520 / NBRC 10181 / NCYC 3082 / Yp74L-3) TaxID=1071383 RepID=J7REL6_HUIN7|nr:hypothetical protein KNAG_0A02890 [Kazachstania naganishii CBS 8797]CCK67978.1 hypothetical protein KNAG_0A02890 [Kazachstania naganishii CBS 8797]